MKKSRMLVLSRRKKSSQPVNFSQLSFETLHKEYWEKYEIVLKNDEQIEGIRKACRLAAFILKETCEKAKEGVTTNELNAFAHQLHLDAGAIPAPLHYGEPPFPKSICTSLNDVICHGIPDDRPLQQGDIVNIDITANLNGYFGDCSQMVTIGSISEESQRVVKASKECLDRAIAVLYPSALLSSIGRAIEACAKAHRCSVVHQFIGHGVGVHFHEAPHVFHYANSVHTPLAPGMIFTIEPMINAGVPDAVIDPDDHWTAYTQDGKASAQFEHTVLITRQGVEILTQLE